MSFPHGNDKIPQPGGYTPYAPQYGPGGAAQQYNAPYPPDIQMQSYQPVPQGGQQPGFPIGFAGQPQPVRIFNY